MFRAGFLYPLAADISALDVGSVQPVYCKDLFTYLFTGTMQTDSENCADAVLVDLLMIACNQLHRFSKSDQVRNFVRDYLLACAC